MEDEGVIFEAMDPGRFLQESASVAEKTGFGPDSYFLVKNCHFLTIFPLQFACLKVVRILVISGPATKAT